MPDDALKDRHARGRQRGQKAAPLELPSAVARSLVKGVRAYFSEEDGHKRDAIAVRQLHALEEYQGPREKKLRLSDVKEMFREMKGIVG